MSQIKMSVLMRIFPKSVKNGRNQASKFQENLEVFFCPFFRKAISETNNLWYNILEVIQTGEYHRERAEHKSNAGQSDLYLKNKSNLFLWQVQSGASCFILQVRQGTVASFLNPDLTNKSWDVHLYCALMACGDGCTAFPQKARRTYQRKS